MFAQYKEVSANLADQLYQMQHRELPDGWDKNLPTFPADAKGIATRESSSGKVLNALAQEYPLADRWLRGSGHSNKTTLKFEGAGDFEAGSYAGRNFHFGVREHAMGASREWHVTVTVSAPFGATFFNFSDYCARAIRLAALMEMPVIFIFTHDSIGVGEDGPTHQPIEQLASLRAMPNLIVLRPGDANEVVEAWKIIAQLQHQPVALVLSRQALPTLDRTKYGAASGVAKGAYILADAPGGKPDVILMGTGSEFRCVLMPTRSSRRKASRREW